MRFFHVIALLILLLPAVVHADAREQYALQKAERLANEPKVVEVKSADAAWEIDGYNVALATAFTALCVIDWRQTIERTNRPDLHESNSILGKRPSEGRINTYFAVAVPVVHLVSLALPNPFRYWFQGAATMIEFSCVNQNWEMGLRGHW